MASQRNAGLFLPLSSHPLMPDLISIIDEEWSKAIISYYFLSSMQHAKNTEANLKNAITGSFWNRQENWMDLSKIIPGKNHACGYFFESVEHLRTLATLTVFSLEYKNQLYNAVYMARRASFMAPDSAEYSLFYALLILMKSGCENYLKNLAIEECERGLLIKNPRDAIRDFIWLEVLGKERSEIGVADRLISEEVKKKIKMLMVSITGENDAEELPADEDAKICKLKQSKKNVDVRFMVAESMKLRFSSPIEEQNPQQASDRKIRIMGDWNRLSFERKIEALKVSITKVREHFAAVENNTVIKVIDEAIDYAKRKRKWMCWFCYLCNKKFDDIEAWRCHMGSDHQGELEHRCEQMKPEIVGDWCRGYNKYGIWQPSNLSELAENRDQKKRAELVCAIQGLLNSLINHNCFATSHFEKVMKDYLMVCCKPSEILYYGLESICFLDTSHLKKVLQFLKDLAMGCGLSCYTDNVVSNLRHIFCLEERILMSNDSLSLVLDKISFPETPYTGTWCTDENSYAHVNDDDCEKIEVPDGRPFINWLCMGPTLEEHMDRLETLKEASKIQAITLMSTIEEEFKTLKHSCEEKERRLKILSIAESVWTKEEKESGYEEVCKLDANILAGLRFRQRALKKLEMLCCWDYSVDMIPMLKLFILAQMEQQSREYTRLKVAEEAPMGQWQLLHFFTSAPKRMLQLLLAFMRS